MNTTRTTSKATVRGVYPAFTITGGAERGGNSGVSLVLLNRGARYSRRSLFNEMAKVGFDYIVSVEGGEDRYDINDMVTQFPFVKFLQPAARLSTGAQVNLAVGEIDTPLFLVLWNDLEIVYGGDASKIASRLVLSAKEAAAANGGTRRACRRLCTLPVFQDAACKTEPTAARPHFNDGLIAPEPFPPEREDTPSIYPYDAVGLYDRARFVEMGGFDEAINDDYWQFLDFGFRSWLWGDEIRCTQLLRLHDSGLEKVEKITYNADYARFLAKNIYPMLKTDNATERIAATLSPGAFLPFLAFYLSKMRGGPWKAWRVFHAARQWVRSHQFAWRIPASALLNNWETTVE
jgi:hypothetical protein